MIPFEDLRRQFRDCHARGDAQGVHTVLSKLIDTILDTRYAESERRDAIALLVFWSDNLNCGDSIMRACNTKEDTLRKQLQRADNSAQDLKKALDNRTKWIEKLELIIAIQQLQNDPSRQVNQQIECLRNEVKETRARADRLEQTVRACLEDLENL